MLPDVKVACAFAIERAGSFSNALHKSFNWTNRASNCILKSSPLTADWSALSVPTLTIPFSAIIFTSILLNLIWLIN